MPETYGFSTTTTMRELVLDTSTTAACGNRKQWNTVAVADDDNDRTICMNCGGDRLYKFIDLGKQPNGNTFPEDGAYEAKEKLFDLSMMVCQDCWQVQISQFPSEEYMFRHHTYITGVNKPVVTHFAGLAKHIIQKCHLMPKSDLVVDIGCNDGSLLTFFQEQGMRVLGVDPCIRTGAIAKDKGITVLQQFWNKETGQILASMSIRPKVITATCVFYHVPDLHSFILGLKEVMEPDSYFVAQCVSLREMMDKNEFDHLYHEHSAIHSITALQRLFEQHGMRIQDYEETDIHGGSFIIYVVLEAGTKKDGSSTPSALPPPTTSAVAAAIRAEEEAGLCTLKAYDTFRERIQYNTSQLRELLHRLKYQEGKTIYGLGAPVKGATLLNYCGIGPDLVTVLTEVNQAKIGKLMPGVNIPIVHESTRKALDQWPDYYLVLPWNYADFLRDKYDDFLRAGGRFIVPCPTVEIVGPKERIIPATVLVTGGTGVVGSALKDYVDDGGAMPHETWIFISSKEGDLRQREDAEAIFRQYKPTHVIHLATKRGGLEANMEQSVEFLRENIMINDNVLECCRIFGATKLVSCLSSCVFPANSPFPVEEHAMHNGAPHQTFAGLAYSKRLVDIQNKFYAKEYGCKFTSVIPTNCYGPKDSHTAGRVIPSLVHKCYQSKINGEPFQVWGSGKPLRQFIFSRDLAELMVWVMRNYEESAAMNLTVDETAEVSIERVAQEIANAMNFSGKIVFDASKPDGQYRRPVSTKKLRKFLPDYKFTPLREGIQETVEWYLAETNLGRRLII